MKFKNRDMFGKDIQRGDNICVSTTEGELYGKVVEEFTGKQFVSCQFETKDKPHSINTDQLIRIDFSENQYVAVYGTLLSNMPNHGYMFVDSENPAEFITTTEISGFDMYPVTEYFPWNYPFCVEGEGTVVSEIYKVSPLTMAYLDNLEGFPRLYDRKVIDIGQNKCHIYFMGQAQLHTRPLENKTKIEDGDWRKFMVTKLRGYIESIKVPSV